ncbi:helix-turn-helix transcriptional regulator [Microbulbifer sp.]|uniref:helix-turn-helix transcriptional regulator n=1 Tax=Microbulbifer sp. TaxID=1908541 RepID=UPI003F329072
MNETLSDRALATARLWAEAARERGWWISPDSRVGLRTAADLMGLSYGTVRNLVSEGKFAPTYRIGGGGHQKTVRLLELAEWLEQKRES